MKQRFVLRLAIAVAVLIFAVHLNAQPPAKVRELLQQKLPSPATGQMQVSLLEVTYPPGGASKPHTHPCPVVGYVVRGAVRMKIGTDAAKIYRPGDVFYEASNALHSISGNASQTEPATFIAYFVCGSGNATELSIPAPNGGKQ